MISQVDDALRAMVQTDAVERPDVEVVFDAPTKDWAARRNAPTVNMYLYDIREDLRRREVGWSEGRGADGYVVARSPAPRFFKLSYLVTAWTKRAEDEHRLLADLLRAFVRYEALPDELMVGPLATTGLSARISVGLPPPEDRSFADVWSALGGELKPSLDVVVIAPMDTGVSHPAGGPVTEGTYVDLNDLVDGGSDERRHKHVPPPPSDADSGRVAGRAVGTVQRGQARKRGTA
ncbi:MAG: DUF4255 domain-containing protein [Pseudonocardiales bacterium]|nr:MAG: DUF4255 domain-containing protein [Pseudonocardiales bacterium]